MLAIAMLAAGILLLMPAAYLALEALQVSSFDAENMLFLVFGTVPAIGGALVTGAAWLFVISRRTAP